MGDKSEIIGFSVSAWLGSTIEEWVPEIDSCEQLRYYRVDEIHFEHDMEGNNKENLLAKLFTNEPEYVKIIVENECYYQMKGTDPHPKYKSGEMYLTCVLFGFGSDGKIERVQAPIPDTDAVCNADDFGHDDTLEKYDLAQREYMIKIDRWLLEVNPRVE